ncbi:MAG: homoserine dehydrogenase [Clostridia bacterium]|nr:homoserine dehydrogenase [Clostridia bacterium]
MKNVAILGFGTVGSGVYEMLSLNAEKIEKAANTPVKVKYILDIRDFSDREDAHIFTKDFNVILEDDEVDIVAEVIGGIHPAYDFTKAALLKGKSVVTSNKELVATKGAELLKIAKENNVNYLFEASVGGGIPLIAPIHNYLAANEIEEVGGILNGTTNYILTEMFENGQSFDEALKCAQELGYAERKPEADVEGLDACRKISILMSLVTGKFCDSEKIYTEGITNIDEEDVAYAEMLDSVIKLVAYGKNTESGIYAAVRPAMIKKENPLASVRSVFNAAYVKGNAVGKVMFYGRGAGKMPTASAVISDILDIAKSGGYKGYFWEEEAKWVSPAEVRESYFVRVSSKDEGKLREAFSDKDIIKLSGETEEIALVTEPLTEKSFEDKFRGIGVIKKIRLLGEDE